MSATASRSRWFLPLVVHRKVEKIEAKNNLTVCCSDAALPVLGLEIKPKKGLLIKSG
jgi:hypothetical protein